jgi:hypothetical protein
METLTYGAPLLFRSPVWVHLASDSEVLVALKPLSYSQIISSRTYSYIISKDPIFKNVETMRTTLSKSIIEISNAYGFPDIPTIVSQLSAKDVEYLYKRLLQISEPTDDQLQELEIMLEIHFSPTFSDETWQCKICQERKLDYNRACGFLPPEQRDPNPILPRVNGKRPFVCPKSQFDNYVLNQAILAYRFWDNGSLPEPGGMGEQTAWFVYAAMICKRKINEAEQQQLEDQKNQRAKR